MITAIVIGAVIGLLFLGLMVRRAVRRIDFNALVDLTSDERTYGATDKRGPYEPTDVYRSEPSALLLAEYKAGIHLLAPYKRSES